MGTKSNFIIQVLLALAFVVLAFRSVTQIFDVNDFEVFVMGAEMGAERDLTIYTAESPEKSRPFIYPPSAIVLFQPLAWFPWKVSGVLWSALKMVALALLLWGAVKFSATSAEQDVQNAFWPLVLATFVVALAPVSNDMGNGQVNILVAALAAGGVWLMMAGRKWSWLGGLPLAAAIAIKLTPALLLAVPFLQRRWGALVSGIAFTVLLMVALPFAWFGGSGFRTLSAAYAEETHKLMMEAKQRDRQVSFNEFLVFTLAQSRAPEGLRWEDEELVYGDGEQQVEVVLPDPLGPRDAKALWFAQGVVVGVLYLVGRVLLFRGRKPDWTWDLAMLCTLSLLLSPLVRKAHLVLLIVPLGWICARLLLLAQESGGWVAMLKRHRIIAALAAAIGLTLLVSEDLPIHLPSSFPMPYHPALMVGLVVMVVEMGMLARVSGAERD